MASHRSLHRNLEKDFEASHRLVKLSMLLRLLKLLVPVLVLLVRAQELVRVLVLLCAIQDATENPKPVFLPTRLLPERAARGHVGSSPDIKL